MEVERDVIFTPNETAQVPGKVLYYHPNGIDEIDGNDGYGDKILEHHSESQNDGFAWLKPLKHALYLVLNNKINANYSERYGFQVLIRSTGFA